MDAGYLPFLSRSTTLYTPVRLLSRRPAMTTVQPIEIHTIESGYEFKINGNSVNPIQGTGLFRVQIPERQAK